VRRAVPAVVGVALVGALALAPASDWSPHGGRAEAAECSWHRHSKRVVKHVRRHGRTRRVVRTRRWWTCDQVPPAAAAPTAPAPAPGPAPEPEPPSNRLGVKAHEYAYELSRPEVSAGEVTIELNNQGEDAHNLNLQRQGGAGEPVYAISDTESQQQRSAHFDLPEGTYRLWCSLPTHEEEGMYATLIVAAG
jgi:plastocyanin